MTAKDDDAGLSALLDDALPPEEAERLRARLAAEPALLARFERIQLADTRVREAYAGVADEPLPQRVLDLLDMAETGDRDDTVVPLRRRIARTWLNAPVALAAGIAFAAGVATMLLSSPRGPGEADLLTAAGSVVPGSALATALDTGLSGDTYRLTGEATATVRLSFLDTAGDYCRQIDVASPEGTSHALACHRRQTWRIELVGITPPGPADGVFAPAAGTAPEAIQTAVTAMMAGAPLARDEEARLAEQGWAAP